MQTCRHTKQKKGKVNEIKRNKLMKQKKKKTRG